MAGHEHCCGVTFWVYIIIVVGLVSFAGLMSGLTLGLMSLGRMDLEVLIKSGKEKDRKHAEKILPVVENQHLLLCTLLVCNSLAMEALPIFLDSLVTAWAAILISVTLILMFGEILPQAVCTRYGLAIGATMAPVVRILVLVCFPVTYPISKLLDFLLGKNHVALFRRAELKTLVNMHGNEAGKGGELTHDETTIIAGALELTEKNAGHAMTPLSSVFAVEINEVLTKEFIRNVLEKGHSRIPVYVGQPKNIIGVILVKNLLAVEPSDGLTVRDLTIRKIPRFPDKMPLYDILNEFQKGHSHMAVVVKYSKEKEGALLGNPQKSLARKLSGIRNPEKTASLKLQGHLSENPRSDVADARPLPIRSQNAGLNQNQPSRRMKKLASLDIINTDNESSFIFPDDEEVVGIITMEDVIEELLQEEIFDETDIRIDLTKMESVIPEDREMLSNMPSNAAEDAVKQQPSSNQMSNV